MKESSSSSSIRLGGAVISDRVVAALLEELRTGRYADADRLPAEVDLAAELGVSRTVIRDALSAPVTSSACAALAQWSTAPCSACAAALTRSWNITR